MSSAKNIKIFKFSTDFGMMVSMPTLDDLPLPKNFYPARTARENFRVVHYPDGRTVILIRPTYHDLEFYLRNHRASLHLAEGPKSYKTYAWQIAATFVQSIFVQESEMWMPDQQFSGSLNKYLAHRYYTEIDELRRKMGKDDIECVADLSEMTFGFEGGQNHLPPLDISAAMADFSGAYVQHMVIAPASMQGVTLKDTYPTYTPIDPSPPDFKLSVLTKANSEPTTTYFMPNKTTNVALTHPKSLESSACFRVDKSGTRWMARYSITQSAAGDKVVLVKPSYAEIQAFITTQKGAKKKQSLQKFLHTHYQFPDDVTLVPDLSGMGFGIERMGIFEGEVPSHSGVCHETYDFSGLDLSSSKCVGTTFGPHCLFDHTNLSHVDARDALFDQSNLHTAQMHHMKIGGTSKQSDTVFLSPLLVASDAERLAPYCHQKQTIAANIVHAARHLCHKLPAQWVSYFDGQSRYPKDRTNPQGRGECQRAVGAVMSQLAGGGMGVYAATYLPIGGLSGYLAGAYVGGRLGYEVGDRLAQAGIHSATANSHYINTPFGDDLAKLGCLVLVAEEAGIEKGKLGLAIGAFLGTITGGINGAALAGAAGGAALATSAAWKELKKANQLLEQGHTPEEVVAEMRRTRERIEFWKLAAIAMTALVVGTVLIAALPAIIPISGSLATIIGTFAAIATGGIGYGISRLQSTAATNPSPSPALSPWEIPGMLKEERAISVPHPEHDNIMAPAGKPRASWVESTASHRESPHGHSHT